jgi:hypothetical protein
MMKNLIKALCIAAIILSSANQVSADDIKIPLVGEWTNAARNADIYQLRFFPNGLLTVLAKGNGWSARYKITSSSVPRSDIYIVNGYIKVGDMVHFADGGKDMREDKMKPKVIKDNNMQFTAKLANHQKVMTLQVDNDGNKKEFTLLKSNDIKTGNIPVK